MHHHKDVERDQSCLILVIWLVEKFRSFEMYAGQVSSYQEFVSELSVKLSTQSFSQIDLPPGRRLEIYPRGAGLHMVPTW